MPKKIISGVVEKRKIKGVVGTVQSSMQNRNDIFVQIMEESCADFRFGLVH